MSNKGNKKGLSTDCPACDASIHFRRLPRRGQIASCLECGSLLQVVQPSPLTLGWAFEEPLTITYQRRRSKKEHDEQTYPQGADDGGGEMMISFEQYQALDELNPKNQGSRRRSR